MQAMIETARVSYSMLRWLILSPWMMFRIAYLAPDFSAGRQVLIDSALRMLRVCRFEVVTKGAPPSIGSGCVLCYNESSFADVFAIVGTVFPFVDHATAADVFGKIPFARLAQKRIAIHLVRRGNRAATDALIDEMVVQLRDGQRVCWGGEGRQSGVDGIGHFKIGASLVAIRAQVPIVPVVVHGGHRRLRSGTFRARPGQIVVTYGEPVSTAGLTEADARNFTDQLRDRFVAIYNAVDEELAITA